MYVYDVAPCGGVGNIIVHRGVALPWFSCCTGVMCNISSNLVCVCAMIAGVDGSFDNSTVNTGCVPYLRIHIFDRTCV